MNKPELKNNTVEQISGSAAILSLTEIGLGSLLHSFKIPFTGHFLSLNQAFILGRVTLLLKEDRRCRFAPAQISLISSLLKSLSPAGKKLTPMLAISAQGFLFNLGTLVFGINPIGVWVGAVILSIWSFVQPIGIYIILFGENLIFMGQYFLKKLSFLPNITVQEIWIIVLSLVAIKITLATIITFLVFYLNKEQYQKWQDTLIKKSERKRLNLKASFEDQTFSKSVKGAAKDLFNPLFILTWFFTGLFFIFAKSSHSSLVWILCRPLIIGFLLFLSIRILPLSWLIRTLDSLGFQNFSQILKSSIDKLKNL